jgi:hypothetical protein
MFESLLLSFFFLQSNLLIRPPLLSATVAAVLKTAADTELC